MASDREYSSTNAETNLTGFSSNSDWADFDALWSHHPVIEGPKDGFLDPVGPEPAREQIWGNS